MKGLTRLVHSPFVTDRNPRAPSPPKGRPRPTRASFPAKAAAAASPSASRYPSLSAQYEPGEKPVVVVGSANADIYVEVDRLPAVGETISARTGQTLAGGKGANQACCGGKLAHPTYFVGQVGEDAHGRLIEEALESGGVLLGHLTRVPAAPTGHAVVMLQPDGQNSIIIVGGANVSGWPERLSEEDLEVVRKAGVLLLQREIPDRVNIQVAEAAQGAGVPVILDAGGMEGPIPLELLKLVDIFSPNETELARLTGLPTETFEQISQAVRRCHEMKNRIYLDILWKKQSRGIKKPYPSKKFTVHSINKPGGSHRMQEIHGVKKVLVKLGSKGSALFVEGKEPIRQPIIEASRVLDTTGAGDTFTAAFGVALVEGKTMEECLRFAAAAASLCIQVKGAIPSMPERSAVTKLLQSP